MAVWITSDEHYGHANIIKHCNRPFQNAWHMNETIIANHKAVVKEGDDVWHLGDFAWNRSEVPGLLQRLNGKHFLIPGNHDACFPSKKGWEKRAADYTAAGFTIIGDGIEAVKQFGLSLHHMPPLEPGSDGRYPEYRPVVKKPLLHGHVHERWQTKKIGGVLCINVGVDVWNYTPVSLKTLLEMANVYTY